MKNIILIAATGQNNELGKNNKLLWHLPDDFKHFKNTTTGHTILMGRKTFESFPQPLPNRKHIIITKNTNYPLPSNQCLTATSITNALKQCEKEETIYVIGGGEIYNQMIPYATKIILTHINASFDADTFFPTICPTQWKLDQTIHHPADEKHPHSFDIKTYSRIK